MTRVTQQHVDARRESILDAAARLFARNGISGATMAEIAAEADLSAGAIYRYFGSKEELLRAVFEEAATRNQEMFRQASENAESPFETLERVGRRIWVEQEDRDDLICEIQMALSAARDPHDFGAELARNRQVVRELLEQTIRAAQQAGEIDPEVDASTLALILQACTGGIQMLKLEDGEAIDAEAAFELFKRMVIGLGNGAHRRTGR